MGTSLVTRGDRCRPSVRCASERPSIGRSTDSGKGGDTCGRLQRLDLAETRVSDLSPVENLVRLSGLNLRRTQGVDITPLARLTGLRWLYLNDMQVSNVMPLKEMTMLRKLNLKGTRVADLTPLAELTSVTVHVGKSQHVKIPADFAGRLVRE
jgi:Leucine-rich repeat (LRR) protein